MQKSLVPVISIMVIALLIAVQTFFIVDQRQQAIVLQLGDPVGEPRGPGLHMKIPLIQSVQFFDSRVLSVDPDPEQVVISSSLIAKPKTDEEKSEADANGDAPAIARPVIKDVSGEPIIVDTFARYKIVDPLQFLKTLRTVSSANLRLETILNDATRGVLGRTTLKELLSIERNAVMNEIKARVNRRTSNDKLGIEIVDVRIVRADLTADLRTSTVRRMISELKERATETRAKGEERALEIRSTAEKERTVLLAEARRDAEKMKGLGDNEAIKTYAEAFNKDKEFYGFIRSMEAYSNTLASPDTRLILSPESDFLRYFRDRGVN